MDEAKDTDVFVATYFCRVAATSPSVCCSCRCSSLQKFVRIRTCRVVAYCFMRRNLVLKDRPAACWPIFFLLYPSIEVDYDFPKYVGWAFPQVSQTLRQSSFCGVWVLLNGEQLQGREPLSDLAVGPLSISSLAAFDRQRHSASTATFSFSSYIFQVRFAVKISEILSHIEFFRCKFVQDPVGMVKHMTGRRKVSVGPVEFLKNLVRRGE